MQLVFHTTGASGCRGGPGVAERRHVAQGVEVLPGDTLRVCHPMLFAARVAAGGFAFIKQRDVGGLGACFQLGQLVGVVSLEAQVIDASGTAASGDREVHARVVEHPLRIVGLDAGRL